LIDWRSVQRTGRSGCFILSLGGDKRHGIEQAGTCGAGIWIQNYPACKIKYGDEGTQLPLWALGAKCVQGGRVTDHPRTRPRDERACPL